MTPPPLVPMTTTGPDVLGSLPWRKAITTVEWAWLIKPPSQVWNQWPAPQSSASLSISFSLCVVGITFDLNEVTDLVESTMLAYQPDHISIYSCSWGPSDSGFTVAGPEKYTRSVLQQGASQVTPSLSLSPFPTLSPSLSLRDEVGWEISMCLPVETEVLMETRVQRMAMSTASTPWQWALQTTMGSRPSMTRTVQQRLQSLTHSTPRPLTTLMPLNSWYVCILQSVVIALCSPPLSPPQVWMVAALIPSLAPVPQPLSCLQW